MHQVLVRVAVFKALRQRHVGGGKAHAGVVGQADALPLGGKGIVGLQVVAVQPVKALEQNKEVVALGFVEEYGAQIRGCVPLRIGHA
ncbi:hypothetical protein D3C76_1525410 [compost metagenome]